MDPIPKFVRPALATKGRESVNPFSQLPNEILELVFSYIRPKTLVQNVLPVCRRFYDILCNEIMWHRKLKTHPLNIRLCEAEMSASDFSVIRTYDAIVTEEVLPNNWNEKERYITSPTRGFVSSIKLFKDSGRRFCLSTAHNGLLDRYTIKLWSVDMMHKRCTEDDSLLFECDSKTKGDMDEIAMHSNNQFAACIRRTVKLWDIGNSSIREVSARNYGSGVGASALSERILACSTMLEGISLLDLRNGMQEIALSSSLEPPRPDIIQSLSLKGNTLYILHKHQLLTADIRKFVTPTQIHEFDNVAGRLVHNHMHLNDGLIHCCHTGGDISVLRENDLHLCYKFQVERGFSSPSFVHRVLKSKGSVIALTTTGLRAYSLGSQPVQLGYYNKFGSGPTVVDTLDGDIVVGSYDGSITAWTNGSA